MPGTSLVFDRRGTLGNDDQGARAAAASMFHAGSPDPRLAIQADHCLLHVLCPDFYDVEVLEAGDLQIVFEGSLYGEPSLRERLLELAVEARRGPGVSDALSRWVGGADGEFLLTIYDRARRALCVLNDAKGMLATFYSHDEDRLVLSRELSYVREMLPRRDLDRLGMAQYTLFKYCLGDRTPFRDVRRLEPGTILRISAEDGLRLQPTCRFTLGASRSTGRSIRANARDLADLVVDSCRRRLGDGDKGPRIVSLSGGVDSRLVAAGLYGAAIPCQAATFLDAAGVMARDVEVADTLARALDWPWQRIDLGHPAGRDALELLQAKGGLNFLSMSFILPFFRRLITLHGPRLTYVTGDTGMAFRVLRSPDRIRTTDQLVRAILLKHASFDPALAAGLVGLTARELLDSIRCHVEAYPEREPGDRLAHFAFYERGLVWHYDGMDRNRFFFRYRAPLEALPVVSHVLACPDEQKEGYRLFAEIFALFGRDLERIDNANYGAPSASLRMAAISFVRQRKVRAFQMSPAWLKVLVRRALGRARYPAGSTVHRCLQRQLDPASPLADVFDPRRFQRAVATSSKAQLEMLWTIASAAELFLTGRSSIASFADDQVL